MSFILVVGATLAYFHYMDDPGKTPPDADNQISSSSLVLELVSVVTGQPDEILGSDLQVSSSGHADLHGCFETTMSLPMLTETYQLFDQAKPVVPVGGLDCYDAEKIKEAMAADSALAFLSRANVTRGLDRVVVIYDDGRGFVWNQPTKQE